MESHTEDEEIKLQLASTNEQFRSLVEQHTQLKRQIEEIEKKPHVTEADEMEEHRLKKLKLYVKDQINNMMAQQRHAAIA